MIKGFQGSTEPTELPYMSQGSLEGDALLIWRGGEGELSGYNRENLTDHGPWWSLRLECVMLLCTLMASFVDLEKREDTLQNTKII